MLGTPGAETVGDAYFGFYLLAMGRGRARTPEQLKQMLTEAGFSGRNWCHAPAPADVSSSRTKRCNGGLTYTIVRVW